MEGTLGPPLPAHAPVIRYYKYRPHPFRAPSACVRGRLGGGPCPVNRESRCETDPAAKHPLRNLRMDPASAHESERPPARRVCIHRNGRGLASVAKLP
ncbi:hypothetical protein RGUI_3852 [Rhodovulum sp. P5]|nr:hypothetical protein RGUI_3852 [Rhodovulum sp. P5]